MFYIKFIEKKMMLTMMMMLMMMMVAQRPLLFTPIQLVRKLYSFVHQNMHINSRQVMNGALFMRMRCMQSTNTVCFFYFNFFFNVFSTALWKSWNLNRSTVTNNINLFFSHRVIILCQKFFRKNQCVSVFFFFHQSDDFGVPFSC